MKILEKKKMSIKLIIMWNIKIDLLMIKIGKTEEIEIISTIQRINLLSFYHFYNSNNEDKYGKQNINFSCSILHKKFSKFWKWKNENF